MKPLPSLPIILLLVATPVRATVEVAYAFHPAAHIPDNGHYVDSRLIVSPGFESITSVSLDLALGGTSGGSMWLGDLYATLTHGTALEDERVAVLLNRPGRDTAAPFGSDLGSLSITLEDAAPANVFHVTVPGGVFQPDGRLSVDPYAAPVDFVPGGQTLGQLAGPWLTSNRWSLLVADTTPGDTAQLESWTLRVRGTLAPGAPVTISAATATFSTPLTGPVLIEAGGVARFLGNSEVTVTLTAGAMADFFGTVTGSLDTTAGGTVRLRPGAVLAPGVFALGSNATLTGSGIVASPATVGGTLSPGQSPGILTFTAGLALAPTSTTIFEIGGPLRGTDHDGIDLTTSGELVYGGSMSLVFSAPMVPGTYSLFKRQEPVSMSGDFALVSISGSFVGVPQITLTPGSGWSALVDSYHLNFTNETGDLVVALIPEPAINALGAGILALALGVRRKR